MEVKCNLPDKWDFEADVVIVGYGGAGAVAAITAHDAGAKILILEKSAAGAGRRQYPGSRQGWLKPVPDRKIDYLFQRDVR